MDSTISYETLTEEECEIVKKHSTNPDLTILGATFGNKYYGVCRKQNKEAIEELEKILIKWLPDMSSFSNFTGTTPNKIRYQSRYNHPCENFEGVAYIVLPESGV